MTCEKVFPREVKGKSLIIYLSKPVGIHHILKQLLMIKSLYKSYSTW